MSTITKERIELFIKNPLENGLTRGEQMELARIALASLEAEAVHQFIYNNPYEEGYTEWLDCNKDYFNGVPEDCRRILYTAPPAPVVPDGFMMVPIEPTEHMIVEGFESEPDEYFSNPEVWEAYQAMSGCQQAAHRAKLCWTAMINAAPKMENV
ncbi:hypothetical protein STW0522ENT62_32720 [Enterobacter kobei]|uniref:hypothetical protein n=1 Tax=Enterobacter kobei TaxID=208224 RepID=UPI0018A4F03D|nr:hypothetical protein [Enterobacter kobei]BBV87826.1 hypothetical protein STW0522ENT62_32720 [Enterobacter kobei]